MMHPMDAIRRLRKIADARVALCGDPMTDAMGAPVGDFLMEYDRRERRLLGVLIRRGGKAARAYALGRMERWMP